MNERIIIKDNERLVIEVPSKSTPKLNYFLTITKKPERTICQCKGYLTRGYCHHILDNRDTIKEFLEEPERGWVEHPAEVQYFNRLLGKCVHSMHVKARKFIEYDCLQYDSDQKVFVCNPIEGYNSTRYILSPHNGTFSCDCQGYVKKKEQEGEGFCSHVLALCIFLKRKENEQLVRNNCGAGR